MRYECLTDEQQAAYDRLLPRQQMFIDGRVKGLNGMQAALMAGYPEKSAKQVAYNMEKRHAGIKEIIRVILASRGMETLKDAESALNKKINKLAKQELDLKVYEGIDKVDGEKARQIQFYRDIISGKTKTVKVRKSYNAAGTCTGKVVEEVSDVEVRIRARKELDILLGYDRPINLDKFKVGDITVNIVDASKKDRPERIVDVEAEKVSSKEEFYEVTENGGE